MSLFYGYEDKVEKVEEEIKKNELPLSGGKMSGNTDMKLNCINNLKAPIDDTDGVSKIYMSTFINSYIYTNLIETLIWEYYTQKGTAMFKVDHGSSSEASFDSSRKVSVLYDQAE